MLTLIGVVVGALLAGSSQASLAWLQTRRVARTSAKLLLMSMLELGLALNKGPHPTTTRNHAKRALATWEAHSKELASALSVADFLELATYFTALQTAVVSDEKFVARAEEFAAMEDEIQVLKSAAMTIPERRRNDRRVAAKRHADTAGADRRDRSVPED